MVPWAVGGAEDGEFSAGPVGARQADGGAAVLKVGDGGAGGEEGEAFGWILEVLVVEPCAVLGVEGGVESDVVVAWVLSEPRSSEYR